jgi:hypothetical protein
VAGADQTDRLAGRNGDIWRAYITGRNQEWIGHHFGLSQQRVSQILTAVREALPDDEREDWRVIAVEALREVHADLVDLVRKPLPPTFSQRGDILRDETGSAIQDASERLATVDRMLRLQERMGRTLGTDAPEKYEGSATVNYRVNGVETGELM